MTSLSEILASYRDDAVFRGGLMLLTADQAIGLVKDCQNENKRVLGLDGFQVTETTTQPFMEHSIDLSRERTESTNKAIEFLKNRRGQDLLFEVVIEEF